MLGNAQTPKRTPRPRHRVPWKAVGLWSLSVLGPPGLWWPQLAQPREIAGCADPEALANASAVPCVTELLLGAAGQAWQHHSIRRNSRALPDSLLMHLLMSWMDGEREDGKSQRIRFFILKRTTKWAQTGGCRTAPHRSVPQHPPPAS